MFLQIPFQLHLAFIIAGALFVLVSTVVVGIYRTLVDWAFNAHPMIIGILCYVTGFLMFYFYGAFK